MIHGTRLTQQDLFDPFTEAEKELLFSHAREKHFRDGDAIFKHGDQGDFMAVVKSGRIRLELYSEDGKDMLIDLIEPGDIVGEFSFLDGKPRSADAVADGPCTLILFDRTHFIPLLQNRPEISLHFASHLIALLRQNTMRIQSLSLLPLPARMARLMLQLATRYGIETANGIRLDDRLDQSDYGRLVASTRESVNKLLRQWQSEKLIDCRKDGIVLHDIETLRTLAEDAA